MAAIPDLLEALLDHLQAGPVIQISESLRLISKCEVAFGVQGSAGRHAGGGEVVTARDERGKGGRIRA